MPVSITDDPKIRDVILHAMENAAMGVIDISFVPGKRLPRRIAKKVLTRSSSDGRDAVSVDLVMRAYKTMRRDQNRKNKSRFLALPEEEQQKIRRNAMHSSWWSMGFVSYQLHQKAQKEHT